MQIYIREIFWSIFFNSIPRFLKISIYIDELLESIDGTYIKKGSIGFLAVTYNVM